MSDNRRNRSHSGRNRIESKVPAWVWLFTGTVLGAFIMFLVRLSETDLSRTPTQPPDKTVESDNKQQPRFDFYDLLKEIEVEVPEIDAAQDVEETKTDTDGVEYILQVASFRGENDADQLRAELILLNLEARVEQAKIRNGETWYRVLVGPFQSRSRLAKARSTLVSNNHEALVLKRTKQG